MVYRDALSAALERCARLEHENARFCGHGRDGLGVAVLVLVGASAVVVATVGSWLVG